MRNSADIQFMKEFRELVDRYLITGCAPTCDEISRSEEFDTMKLALNEQDYMDLRSEIDRKSERAKHIASKCRLEFTIIQPPPFGIGLISSHHLFDLVTDNRTLHNIDKGFILGCIDKVTGALESGLDKRFSVIVASYVVRWLAALLIVVFSIIVLWLLPELLPWGWLQIPWKHFGVSGVGFIGMLLIAISIIDNDPKRKDRWISLAIPAFIALFIEMVALPYLG